MKNINFNDVIIDPSDPQQIFEILDLLGQGAYGSVSKALHKPTGELVAIKIVPHNNDEIDHIKKEIIILKECKSEYIVKYYGSYIKENNLWIVMEYCVAGSVIDVLRITKKQLNEFEIASILQAVLRGLEYLHTNKKIHRDIKAGNILLDQKGNAKLADFGVSTQINTNAQRNTFTGSPYWMSPQILSQTKYNNKTDIWSLGITAIQLAQGSAPYSNMHPYRAMWAIKNQPIKGLHNKNEWSQQFNDFISKCLNNKPDLRPTAIQLQSHPFIQKKARGKAILSQLVLNSMDMIQKYRIKQSKKRFSLEQDQNSLQMKFVQDKKETIKLEGSSVKKCYNLQDQYEEEEQVFDTGTLVIRQQSLKNSVIHNRGEQDNEVPEFMKFAKKMKEVDDLYNNKDKILQFIQNKEKGKQQDSQEQLKNQITKFDEDCEKDILQILLKYRQKINEKKEDLKNKFNMIYDINLLKTFKEWGPINQDSQKVSQIKNINNINSINISINEKKSNKAKNSCSSCQKELKNEENAFKKNKKFKQFVDDTEVFQYLKKNYLQNKK